MVLEQAVEQVDNNLLRGMETMGALAELGAAFLVDVQLYQDKIKFLEAHIQALAEDVPHLVGVKVYLVKIKI